MMIAVSDVHLGHTQQKKEFKEFLDHISEKEISRLMIVGDFLDMWRRDIAGVVIENMDVLNQLEELQKSNIVVDIIAGNHDYHLKTLENRYLFSFHKSGHTLAEFGREYCFFHGYEFDDVQVEGWFELLCLSSDEMGRRFDDFWESIMSVSGLWERLKNYVRRGEMRQAYERMFMTPDERLKYEKVRIKSLTLKEQEGIDFLIYGHTHEPFVSEDGSIANTGSWCETDPEKNPHYNTFLEISKNGIALKKWENGKEVTIDKRFTKNQLMKFATLY